jgi:methylmalonyl-CoA mutase
MTLDLPGPVECKSRAFEDQDAVTRPVIPLAEGFAPVSRADWLALVGKTLKGAGFESLVGRTADDLPLAPLYTAEDSPAPLPFVPAARDSSRSWDIRARISHPEPAVAQAQALEALAGGAASLLLEIEDGRGRGVRLGSAGDLAQALDGVMTDVAPVALDAGFLGPAAAGWLAAVAKASPVAPLALHLDPLSAFAAAGTSPGPIENHLTEGAALAARLADTYPRASLFLANGAVIHEAGGAPAWALGFAASAAVAYAKALVAAGLPIDAAFSRITLGLAADAQPLGVIAKARAARVLWTRITAACGAPMPARIEARSSGRMLTRADRWTNLIRLTAAGFGAAVGGADIIVLGAFTDAIGDPESFALRMARNTQLILMEEAWLGKVADPAGGAWALEAQTADLARAAWASFVAIETAGGIVAALRGGLIARAVDAARSDLKAALASRQAKIIGVTDFASPEATPAADAADRPSAAAPADARQPGPDSHCPPLTAIRLEDLVA